MKICVFRKIVVPLQRFSRKALKKMVNIAEWSSW